MTIPLIVPIAEDHIAGFRHVIDIIAREREFLAFLEAPPLAETRRFVRKNIQKRHPQFVVLNAGSVVGWCDVVPNQTRRLHAHCGTLGIGLLPEFRGQGIGRRLMQRTIDAAFAWGLTRIELTVREGNSNAIALYKSLGFAVEGHHRNAIRIDGRHESTYSMALVKG
jgi:RimJ/RimL family protein N-acetyltransferase